MRGELSAWRRCAAAAQNNPGDQASTKLFMTILETVKIGESLYFDHDML